VFFLWKGDSSRYWQNICIQDWAQACFLFQQMRAKHVKAEKEAYKAEMGNQRKESYEVISCYKKRL